MADNPVQQQPVAQQATAEQQPVVQQQPLSPPPEPSSSSFAPPPPPSPSPTEEEEELDFAVEEEMEPQPPMVASQQVAEEAPKPLPKAPLSLPPRPGTKPVAVAAVPPPPVPVPATAPPAREKRRFKRFNMEFKVILVCEGKTFRTYSSDVSIGGMALKHKVPQFMLENMCRIVIARRDSLENIEFTCRIHGGTIDPRRVEFVDCDPDSVSAFEQWIEKGAALGFGCQKSA